MTEKKLAEIGDISMIIKVTIKIRRSYETLY
ncbi:MAG: hypothetical protein BWX72_00183 [Firmicutes bacterium ADurb.Bin080]|jgi:hypothetical protein|nr:MAG: hypothetical protein BWX72_00183 [Firmicutes bacterium ADurb.Bin080]